MVVITATCSAAITSAIFFFCSSVMDRVSSFACFKVLRGRRFLRSGCEPLQECTQARSPAQRAAQLPDILLADDERRALETAAVIVIAEPNLPAPGRVAVEKFQ